MAHYCAGPRIPKGAKVEDLKKLLVDRVKSRKAHPSEISFLAQAIKAIEDKEFNAENRRTGCGQQLDELIQKVPVDGEEHKIKCPKCGNVAPITRV